MAVRLNKVTRDLNVGISTAVEFLRKKGYEVEENPNAKITDEQFDLLKQEFSTDKALKAKSDQFILGRKEKDKDKAKPAVAIKGYEPAPEKEKQKYKPIGKIDLEKLNKPAKPAEVKPSPAEVKSSPAEVKPKPAEVKPKPAPVEVEEKLEKEISKPKAEQASTISKQAEPVEQPVEVQPSATPETPVVEKREAKVPEIEISENDTPKSVPTDKAEKPAVATNPKTISEDEPENDGIFRLNTDVKVSKINVVGHVDLDQLNTSTRPKKKSKEERKKERDEREKQRQTQRRQMKEDIMKEIRGNEVDGTESNASENKQEGKKKRVRIGKEKVDIKKAAREGDFKRRRDEQQGERNDNGKSKKGKDRFRKPVFKQEVSDEDVTKQVKETLARLTNKTKSKGAKYRKEKRELASERLMEQENMEMAESKILKLTEFVTANELANMMNVQVTQVIATCMSVGIMVSINQRLDAETINLVAEEFGYKTEYVSAEVSQAVVEEEDDAEDLMPRAPIVTVMGHVDHGKTSLLDYIRKSNVIAGEAGGITQHIGAYNVTMEDGRKITFLDTPGHEAFTAMRARGAKVTDIAIIIVAADDSVMPQTREAINHAVAAGVPIVFAINKIDKPGANPDKIKEELAAMNFLVEEWGGKYQSQDISAKKGIGVEELMEKVLLEAELLELKANPNRKATGSIIESSLDKGRGYIATVLVSNGTLKIGDIVLAGSNFGRVKAMFNERNQRIDKALPAEPALILGLNGAPAAGDTFHVFDTDQEAREIANKREQLQREQGLRTQKMLTLDEVGRRLALGDFHELNIIVKGDVDGSVEALSDSLIKLSTDKIQVNVIHQGVGQISESDVSLAAASDAIIVGFQVRPSAGASKLAEQEGVDIRKYSIIYDAIEEVKAAMEGMLAPTLKEQVTSTIEVREVFNISKVGMVAGAMVKTGKVKRSDKARLIRDGIVIYTGNINALKRFKDDVKEVLTNFECGISLTNCNDIKVNDIIETFEEIEIKQTL
ncbi:MAG: translation initiation factor IF-2 [Bacteroidaceae bacterium]|nr:translation initiation factor IF-2 [Bacteroidaceae bacterium]